MNRIAKFQHQFKSWTNSRFCTNLCHFFFFFFLSISSTALFPPNINLSSCSCIPWQMKSWEMDESGWTAFILDASHAARDCPDRCSTDRPSVRPSRRGGGKIGRNFNQPEKLLLQVELNSRNAVPTHWQRRRRRWWRRKSLLAPTKNIREAKLCSISRAI